MNYVEEGQGMDVNSIQASIASQVPPEERMPLIELQDKLFEKENNLKKKKILAENELKNELKVIETQGSNRQEMLKIDLEVYAKQQKKVIDDIDGKAVFPLKKQSNCEEYVKISNFYFLYFIIFSQ